MRWCRHCPVSPGCPRVPAWPWQVTPQPCLALSPSQTPIFQPGEVCRERATATLTQSVNKNQLNNEIMTFSLKSPGDGGDSRPALSAIKQTLNLFFFLVDAEEELRGDPAPAQPHPNLREQEWGTDIWDNTNPWMSHSLPLSCLTPSTPAKNSWILESSLARWQRDTLD